MATTSASAPVAPSEAPSVSLSYANNFWGKDDAGVPPLLSRMLHAKTTCDELRAFYSARAAIEDEYGRKLLLLARKPLGSVELGTLRSSLEVVRSEVEQMGKAHQGFALKMRSDLEDPLAAFAGSMKERRKIVQTGIEKLLKTKTNQTVIVNKARDRYEQECLKIKGYLAQGHMVMGQEERKNKAKLEKTQIQLSTTSAEYEGAVKVLEDTTARWNREWKAACDKFQDLDEERINYMKTSLWAFANLTSTVCVSDDGSCEKMRLSLEECDVEEDIANFISEVGTGQEIPDPPRFIDFCRGDVNDGASEASDEFISTGGSGVNSGGGGGYSVAQFSRAVNPAFHSSATPSHPSQSQQSLSQGQSQPHTQTQSQPQLLSSSSTSPQKPTQAPAPLFQPQPQRPSPGRPTSMVQSMTQSIGSNHSGRPHSRESLGDERDLRDHQLQHTNYGQQYSQPLQQSQQPSSHQQPQTRYSPNESDPNNSPLPHQKSRSSFFASPFRRRREDSSSNAAPTLHTNTGHAGPGSNLTPSAPSSGHNANRTVTHSLVNNQNPSFHAQDPDALPNTQKTQMAVGGNVFDVDAGALMKQQGAQSRNQSQPQQQGSDYDPIAAALAELKVAGGSASARDRNERERYEQPGGLASGSTSGGLGVPEPAFTSRQMRMTKQRFMDQTGAVFGGGGGHGGGMPNRVPVGTRPATSAGTINQTQPGSRAGRSPSPVGYSATGYQNQQLQSHPPQAYSNLNPQLQARNGHSQAIYHNSLSNLSQPSLITNTSLTGRPRAQSSSPIKARHDYDANSWGSRTGGGYITGAHGGGGGSGGGSSTLGRSDGSNMSTALTRSRPTSPLVGQSGGGGGSGGGSSGGTAAYYRAGGSPSPGSAVGRDVRGVSPGGSGVGVGGGSVVGGNPYPAYHSRSPVSHQTSQYAPPPSASGGGRTVPSGRPVSRAAAGGATSPSDNMALALAPTQHRGRSYTQSANSVQQTQHHHHHSYSPSSSRPPLYTPSGRRALHHSKAMYSYTAAIAPELSFVKGDILAVLVKQDDGWWQAEVVQTDEKNGPNPPGVGEAGLGAVGLVPSNYLQTV